MTRRSNYLTMLSTGLFCAGLFCIAQADMLMTGVGMGAPASGVVAVTWDPVNTGGGITLSGGNLIATSNSTTNAFTQTTTSHDGSLKLCLEVHMTGSAVGVTSWIAALVRTTASFPNGYISAINGAWFVNNSNTSTNASTMSSGDFEMMCVDFGAKLIWNKTDTQTNWNNNASGNPATGVGGADISGAYNATDPFVFLVNIQDNVGQVATLNVNGGTFHFSIPSGYSAWN